MNTADYQIWKSISQMHICLYFKNKYLLLAVFFNPTILSIEHFANECVGIPPRLSQHWKLSNCWRRSFPGK